jgi:RND family efflux transporter MFP subunit
VAADQLSSDLASLRIDRREAPPSGSKAWILALLLIPAIGAGGYYGWLSIAPQIYKTEVATTEIIVVSPAQASTELTALGYVVAQRDSKVACKVLSRVLEMDVREGDHVKAGQVLFKAEDREQRAALAEARSRAAATRARIASARASLAQAKQRYRRESTLVDYEAMEKATAEDRLEEMKSLDAASAAAELDAVAADDDVKAREVDLSNTIVCAPFDGVVIGKPLDVGELVGTVTEKPAVEIADPDSLLAEIDVPEKRIDKIKIGGPAEVVLDAYPDNRYRGVVEEISTRVDRSKGTLVVRVKLLDLPPRLLPDMRARAGFLTEKIDDKALKEPPKTIVPRSAVAERGGQKVVFQIEEGHVKLLPIELGPPFGVGFELKKGPGEGTKLVADPPETMADGQPVKEKNN